MRIDTKTGDAAIRVLEKKAELLGVWMLIYAAATIFIWHISSSHLFLLPLALLLERFIQAVVCYQRLNTLLK